MGPKRPTQCVSELHLTVADSLAPLPINNNNNKIFQAISNCGKQKRSSQIFRELSGVFQQDFKGTKISAVLEPRTGQFSRIWGFEAKARTSKCVLEAKDVLEDSTSVHHFKILACSPLYYPCQKDASQSGQTVRLNNILSYFPGWLNFQLIRINFDLWLRWSLTLQRKWQWTRE